MQGFGKSTWTELYAASKKRLLVFDPKGVFKGVDFLTSPDDYIPGILDGTHKEFRVGTYLPEEIKLFGTAAYGATNCTFIMEECAMLFDKGENIAPWARPLVFMGREPQMNLVLVAQRLTSVPPDIRSQASRIVTFLQTEPDDVRALSNRIGDRERADEIRTLPFYTCLDWQAGKGISRYTVHP